MQHSRSDRCNTTKETDAIDTIDARKNGNRCNRIVIIPAEMIEAILGLNHRRLSIFEDRTLAELLSSAHRSHVVEQALHRHGSGNPLVDYVPGRA